MTQETYKVFMSTGEGRENILINPLVYGFDSGDYFDELMEQLSDEMIYMKPEETLILVVRRLS